MKGRRGCTQSTTKGEWLHVKQLRLLRPSRGMLSFSLIDPFPASGHCFHTLSCFFFLPCLPNREAESIAIFQSVRRPGSVYMCVCVCVYIYIYIYFTIDKLYRNLSKFQTNSIAQSLRHRSYFIRNIRNSNIAAALCLMESRHRDCHWWFSTAMKIHAI